MFNPKKIAFPAIFGFVLSFFISIFTTHAFFPSLLRGICFAFIFALLFMAIDFVFTKFLDGASSPEQGFQSKPQEAATGNKVDITIPGEDLSDDGSSLQFSVGKNKLALEEPSKDEVVLPVSASEKANDSATPVVEDLKETKKEESSVNNNQADKGETTEFKPVQLGRTVESPAENAPASAAKKKNAQKEMEKEEIDSLPDIVGFIPEVSGDANSDSEVIEDSDFASGGSGSSSSASTFKDGSKSSDHDAATMAKAIQTILKTSE